MLGEPGVPTLSLEGVEIEYRGRRGTTDAVQGVSLYVDRGESVGLVGESGSGKTSLSLAILGAVPVRRGSITVEGTSLGHGHSQHLARSVQMIFQDAVGALDPRQSVHAGLRELRKVHRKHAAMDDDRTLLEAVGLSASLLDRKPGELSGGQAQRVCIARALLIQPSVLLADEPTSALDVSTQAQILELLRRLQEERGFALLFVSHDLLVVREVCTRVYVMREGVIVEHGETADVLYAPHHEYTRHLIESTPGIATAEERQV